MGCNPSENRSNVTSHLDEGEVYLGREIEIGSKAQAFQVDQALQEMAAGLSTKVKPKLIGSETRGSKINPVPYESNDQTLSRKAEPGGAQYICTLASLSEVMCNHRQELRSPRMPGPTRPVIHAHGSHRWHQCSEDMHMERAYYDCRRWTGARDVVRAEGI
jgi:hypothetical protein